MSREPIKALNGGFNLDVIGAEYRNRTDEVSLEARKFTSNLIQQIGGELGNRTLPLALQRRSQPQLCRPPELFDKRSKSFAQLPSFNYYIKEKSKEQNYF